MSNGTDVNPDAPSTSIEDEAKRLGIDLSESKDTEAAASPSADEARRDDAGPSDEASRTAPAPKSDAEEPSEVGRQQARVRELEERLERIERDYGASSKEAKRLAERVKEADSKLATLKEKYALDELEDWTPQPQAEEDRPVTHRDLLILEEQRRWRTAEETFFSSEKNADLSSPIVKRWVRSLLFTDEGNLVHPNASPRESFELAAKEARKILNAERLRGRQEREQVKEDLKRAAVAEGTGKAPEKKEKPADETPNENEYYDMWQKRKQKRGG